MADWLFLSFDEAYHEPECLTANFFKSSSSFKGLSGLAVVVKQGALEQILNS